MRRLAFQVAGLFRIHGGKVDQIEAVLDTVPYSMPSGIWDEPHAKESPDYACSHAGKDTKRGRLLRGFGWSGERDGSFLGAPRRIVS